VSVGLFLFLVEPKLTDTRKAPAISCTQFPLLIWHFLLFCSNAKCLEIVIETIFFFFLALKAKIEEKEKERRVLACRRFGFVEPK
jgi:hypothetical protein